VAESENVYVKIGSRGRLIERAASTPADHVNLKGTGWVLKGSKGAPTRKDETGEKPETSGLTNTVPTSLRAFADAADTDSTSGKKTATATGAGSSGAAADAKSQAAARQA
jgi:hypothetical protein